MEPYEFLVTVGVVSFERHVDAFAVGFAFHYRWWISASQWRTHRVGLQQLLLANGPIAIVGVIGNVPGRYKQVRSDSFQMENIGNYLSRYL